MPHQREIVDVALELDEAGRFCYREVIVSMPRQMGKTTVLLPVEVDRCTMWGDAQKVLYTAQTGMDARKKLLEDQVPILTQCPLYGLVKRVYQAAGQEAVVWKNGSRISLAASARESGHGFTLDLGILDECWNDEDDRREQAVLPAMKTRPMAQMWLTSTMGTERSTYLNRKVKMGREAAVIDSGSGVAYFEWSIPDDADIASPDVWWEYMPALGYTVSEAVIAYDLQTMEEAEWRRADGNQMTKGAHDRIIPDAVWAAVCNSGAVVDQSAWVVFGVDVLPDRTHGAIVVEHREGTGWIVDRAKALNATYSCRFVVDSGGPAASIGNDLEQAGLQVVRLNTSEVAAACAAFYDAIADRQVAIRTDASLDAAVAGLEKRPLGDRFMWARSTSLADITPFMAATLAYNLARGQEAEVEFYAFD
jgi:hypothetical protein